MVALGSVQLEKVGRLGPETKDQIAPGCGSAFN